MTSVNDLERLAKSFERHLRAENRAFRTVETYGEAIGQLAAHLAREGVTAVRGVTKSHVEAFVGGLVATRAPATANNRFRALQQFFKWLYENEHIARNPMAGLKPPHVPEVPVPVVSPSELRALLSSCKGQTFEDRRDEAIIRLLLDTGIRRSELLGLQLEDMDVDDQVVWVKGKVGVPGWCHLATARQRPWTDTTWPGLGTLTRVSTTFGFREGDSLVSQGSPSCSNGDRESRTFNRFTLTNSGTRLPTSGSRVVVKRVTSSVLLAGRVRRCSPDMEPPQPISVRATRIAA